MNPQISIILPCYNVALYIDRCIESLLNQTFQDFEIICINDGSTDETLNKLQYWQNKWNKINIYTFKNQGLSQARNEGIYRAKGNYLYFLDPDDYIESSCLEIAYNKCEEDKSDAVQFRYRSVIEGTSTASWVRNGTKEQKVYSDSEIITDLLPRFIGYSNLKVSLFGTSYFSHDIEMNAVWRFLYKREIVVNNNILFPKGVKLIEDKIFNSIYFCFCNKISIINDCLYIYMLKQNGLMYSSLTNYQSIVKDKFDGITQRAIIRQLYLKEHGLDIFPLYAGSLFLSGLELGTKISYKWANIKEFKKYFNNKDIQEAIKIIPIKGKIKIRIILFLVKKKMLGVLYTAFFLNSMLKKK